MGADNGETAARGESVAAEWLEQQGWEILERNWTRDLGEVDIVALREVDWAGETVAMIAFVEVKSRETGHGLLPEGHVDARKRHKLVRLAKLYLSEHRLKRVLGRFDVIGVDLDPPQVRHYPAAFDGAGRLR